MPLSLTPRRFDSCNRVSLVDSISQKNETSENPERHHERKMLAGQHPGARVFSNRSGCSGRRAGRKMPPESSQRRISTEPPMDQPNFPTESSDCDAPSQSIPCESESVECNARMVSGSSATRMVGPLNSQCAHLSDVELLSNIARRDNAAFETYFDRHSDRILGLLLRLLSDRAAAEDVLQETFLQVWRTASSFDSNRSGAVVWLSMIARSRARDRIRRDRRVQTLPPLALSAPADVSTSVPPPTTAASAESANAARGALSLLPDDQRHAIRLAFYGGLSHTEIAQHLGLPLGTIKTRIRLGIRRLREILDGQRKVSA